MSRPTFVLTLAGLLTAAGHAQTPPSSSVGGEGHEKRSHDAYLEPGPLRTCVPSVFADRQGFPPSAQANVTPGQLNILNDAANEPSIAVDPTAPNRIVIGWRQFDNVASNFRQAGYAWTNDGGLTWHKNTLTPGTFRSDPVLRAGPDGTIYYNTLVVSPGYECWVFRSTDGGQSWSAPVLSYGDDKQWMVVDRTNGPGRGFIYQMDSFGGFTRSMDGGLTWAWPSAYPSNWGNLAVGPVGQLFGGDTGGTVAVARSLNVFQPAQTPVFSTSTVTMNGTGSGTLGTNPGGLAGQASVGVDTSGGPRHGWVYALATVVGTYGDVVFSRSTDNGSTWSPLYRMPGLGETPFAGAQWFGVMSVAPNGRIDVVYNDTASRHYSLSQLLSTSSHDGGVTWTAPQAMGPVWNSLIGWPNQNKIGDYYDMESDLLGASVAYSATYNGEQDVYFLRIGPRDCNGNGVDDAAETADGSVFDTNGNRIPDSCEIAAGAVADVNGNGIPDDACGDIDFNNDGLFPDSADVDDFISVFGGGPCSTPLCDGIDFNRDQLSPDTGDIDALLRVFAGGPC